MLQFRTVKNQCTRTSTLTRYFYESIANWKLQHFFVDDYKLSSDRYSQYVCGAAIGPGTVGSVISYTGEAHRVTVFLLRIQTKRLRVTSVTIGPEWHASTSHHRRETVSVIILRTCHCAFVTSGIFRLHACLETLYIVRDDTDWTSRLYFTDDYKLLVRILRPAGPIYICAGSLFIAVMLASVQEC